MVHVKAIIRLYNNGRQSPFSNGYRPLFSFVNSMKTSGQIILSEHKLFYPGNEEEVEIRFLSKEYLGNDFKVGSTFTFGEGHNTLGEGKILRIM